MPVRGRARGLGLCAPRPAVGQSDRHSWAGGCTSHRWTRRARRPWDPVCMCRNPFGCGGVRRQGGQQSGAEGGRPLVKHGFADGPEHDEEMGAPRSGRRQDDGPARVAMGRSDFLEEQTERIIQDCRPTVSPHIRLRSTWEKVYASVHRERTFFHPIRNNARAVPRRGGIERCRRHRRHTGLRARASGRNHGRDDIRECNFSNVPLREPVNFARRGTVIQGSSASCAFFFFWPPPPVRPRYISRKHPKNRSAPGVRLSRPRPSRPSGRPGQAAPSPQPHDERPSPDHDP